MVTSTNLIYGKASGQVTETRTRQDVLYRSAVVELGDALGRIAIAYESNPSQQQDLIQEIHIALWRSLATFKGDCALRTWVYRVAHNTATTYALRNQRRRLSKWISLEDVTELVEPTDNVRSIDEQSVRERMTELIRKLRAIDRDVLFLYLEGVDAKEIAEIVGLSPSNVAQKISRTKKILTAYFQPGDAHGLSR